MVTVKLSNLLKRNVKDVLRSSVTTSQYTSLLIIVPENFKDDYYALNFERPASAKLVFLKNEEGSISNATDEMIKVANSNGVILNLFPENSEMTSLIDVYGFSCLHYFNVEKEAVNYSQCFSKSLGLAVKEKEAKKSIFESFTSIFSLNSHEKISKNSIAAKKKLVLR